MLVLDVDPWTAGHLAAAIRAHRHRLRRDYLDCPAELEAIEVAATRRARTSQAATAVVEAAEHADGEPMLLLTKETAAGALSVSPRTIQRLIAAGELPTVAVGRSRRIHRDALDAFVARRAS